MAATKQGTPDTKILHDLIDQLSADIAKSEDGSVIITQDEAQTIVDASIWVCNFLNDRRLYHKTQQIKKRLIEKLIKEQLSDDDIKRLTATAAKLAEQEVLPESEVIGDEENK